LSILPNGSKVIAICLSVKESNMTATAESLGAPKASPKAAKVKADGVKAVAKAAPLKRVKKAVTQATGVASAQGQYVVTKAGGRQPIIALLLPGTNTDDRMEVFRATKTGFPLSSVVDLVESVDAFKRNNVLSKIFGLSDRTLARRMKNKDESLSQEQSARALYYAEILEKAQEVFGTRQLAEEWMIKPALGLDGETPIDLLSNPVGYELVADFLHRLEYGVY
jgi:putative toxin-antitoxin system antitoxin component (TIGR02293 family)